MVPEIEHQLVQPRRIHRVEPGAGLVQEQQGRVQRQRAGQRGALAHAARQRRRRQVEGAVQPHQGQLEPSAALALGGIQRGEQLQRQHQVAAQAHRAPERAGLEHHAEAAPPCGLLGGAAGVQILAIDQHAASGWLLQAHQVAQQRALAAAAGAHDDQHLAGPHVEIQPLLHRAATGLDGEAAHLHPRTTGLCRGFGKRGPWIRLCRATGAGPWRGSAEGASGVGHQNPRLVKTMVVPVAAATTHTRALTTAAVVASPTAWALRPACRPHRQPATATRAT